MTPVFLHNSGLLAQGMIPPIWAGPSHLNQQSKHFPTDKATGQSDLRNSSIETLSSLETLDYVLVTVKINHDSMDKPIVYQVLQISNMVLCWVGYFPPWSRGWQGIIIKSNYIFLKWGYIKLQKWKCNFYWSYINYPCPLLKLKKKL